MRIAVRIVLGLLVLVVVLLGALALLLPRLLDTPEVKAQLAQAARDATGAEATWESLQVGLLPPRLVVEAPSLASPGGGKPLAARRVALSVSLAPLLAGAVVVDTLTVEGASLDVVRTADGVEVSGLPSKPAEEAKPEQEAGAPPAEEKGGGVTLAVRNVALRDASVSFEDRTLRPPQSHRLEQVDLSAKGVSPEAPVPFQLSATLDGATRLEVDGEITLPGDGPVRVQLSNLPLASVAPYLAAYDVASLSGEADLDATLTLAKGALGAAQAKLDASDVALRQGDLQLQGQLPLELELGLSDGRPEKIVARLDAKDLDVKQGELSLHGDVPLRAELARAKGGLAGPVSVDLSAASLKQGDAFTKPAGQPASLSGQLRLADDGGVVLDGRSFVLGPVDGSLGFQTKPSPRIRLDTKPFAPADLAPFVPALAASPPRGSVRVENLSYVFDPPEVHGFVDAEPLERSLEGGAVARLKGRIEGRGSQLRGQGLALEVAGQPLTADVTVGLRGRRDATLALRGQGIQVSPVVAAFGGNPKTVDGTGRLQANFDVPLAGNGPFLKLVRGRTVVEVLDGHWRGVSLLQRTFDSMGAFGGLLFDFGRLKGGRDLQRFYGDEFKRAGGTFDVADGVARTSDLRIEYRGYIVDLRGTLGLLDEALDMTGSITMLEEVDQALADASGAAPAPRVKRTIPLAAVRGTLSEPKVTVTAQTAQALARSLVIGPGGVLGKKLEKELGPGSQQVLDALDSLLGGGRKR